MLPNLDLAKARKLTPEQMTRAALLADELVRRQSQRMFFRLFPDEDTIQPDGSIIHARHKYPKHLEFFDAGAEYRERCFLAANRCITPWTWLETPAGERLSAEAWTSADARVLAWDNGSECAVQAQSGLLKCIEPAFRLVLGNGRFFDCTRKHRVLTIEGWLSLDQIVSRASGLRSWHRRADYQANCDAGGYLGDRPLHSLAGIDLASPPSQGGVQQRAPLIFELTDEVERTLQRSRACPEYDRLSTPDDLRRFADLFSLFSGASTSRSDLSLSGCIQDVLRFVQALGVRLRVNDARLLDLSEPCSCRDADQTECLGGSCTRRLRDAAAQDGGQWLDVQCPGGSVLEWSRDDEHMAIFYPWAHVPLLGGETIVAIVPLGLQPIIDAHVPNLNNYKAAGVFHHNTGKTTAGAFELAAHLTGLYPDWWKGRRFLTAIRAWACGKTNETTRDIVQASLLGEVAFEGSRKTVSGTGMMPGHLLGQPSWKQGVQDLIDTIKVKHVSGKWSTLGLKSYQQGRGSFEGTAQHIVWADEECPLDVYGEIVIRTATTNGLVMLTFTPLAGLSETVLQFLPTEDRPDNLTK